MWILIREVLRRERRADDRHRRALDGILHRELAAAKRNAERRGIAGNRQPPRCRDRFLVGLRRQLHVAGSEVARQRRPARNRHGLDARTAAQVVTRRSQNARRDAPSDTAVAGSARRAVIEARDGKARLDLLQPQEAANQQARSDQERDRERDLGDGQHRANAFAAGAARGRRARRRADASCGSCRAAWTAGTKPNTVMVDQRDPEREGEDASDQSTVHRDVARSPGRARSAGASRQT